MTAESILQGGSVVLTSDLKSTIQNEVQLVLNRKHEQSEKQVIQEAPGRLNFACPYCGDSADDPYKKRGNLFWDSLYYHCYNDGCTVNGHPTHRNAVDFLRDFDSNLTDKDYFDVLYYIKEHQQSEQTVDPLEFKLFKTLNELAVDKTEFFYKHNIYPINDKSYQVYPYLKSRFLHNKLKSFGWNPRTKQLYVFNMNHSGSKILSYQLRNLDTKNSFRKASKYLTFKLSRIRDDMGYETIAVEDMDSIDKISTLHGIATIDFSQNFTIFEGPLDAMFMKNSLALGGINKEPFDFDQIDTVRYFLDNDKAGINKMLKKLENGKSVFLWRKLMEEHKIKAKIKDLNDLVKYAFQYKKKIRIGDYFSDDPHDMINLC